MNDREVEALWDMVPNVHCRGLCQGACTGIGMSKREWSLLDAAGHGNIGYDENTEHCNKLTAFGTCSVYELRPLICRTWGASPNLPCVYGCQPVMSKDADVILNLAMMRLSDEWIYLDEGASQYPAMHERSGGKVMPLPRIPKKEQR